jgi:adenylosuccinate synthase
MNLLGSSVVVYPKQLFEELANLEAKGLKGARERILISDRCHIITDLHKCVDGLEEQELKGKAIGTTGRGIGPAYSTMASRNGIAIHQMFDQAFFEKQLRHLATGYKKRFGDLLKYDVEEEIVRFQKYREDMRPFVIDAVVFLADAQEKNAKLLVEGAQALMLDLSEFVILPWILLRRDGAGLTQG